MSIEVNARSIPNRIFSMEVSKIDMRLSNIFVGPMVLFGVLLLAGCILPPYDAKPELIQHPDAYTSFKRGQISHILDCLPSPSRGSSDCSNDFDAIECDGIRVPKLWWGEPTQRWVWCQTEGESFTNAEYDAYVADGYIANRGVNMFAPERLILIGKDSMAFIKNHAELKEAFSPIESSGDAMAYAIAKTGFNAMPFNDYPSAPSGSIEYFARQVEGSYVQQIASGYDVLLYDSPSSCTPWKTYAIWVRVFPNGDIEEQRRMLVFQRIGGCA